MGKIREQRETRADSEERDERHKRKREKENTQKSDQILMMLIDANVPSSASEVVVATLDA
jgi:hypothetical protein